MVDADRPSKPRSIPPLRLDSATLLRRSQEISPTRSSVQSSSNHTPSSSVPSTPLFPGETFVLEGRVVHPGDSNAFLTALAAQERRVLELKEEVQKAEAELGRLKKQWAAHEAIKKKNELRNLEQLQPFNAILSSAATSHDDDSGRLKQESDRWKKTTANGKPSQRTVFSGSRHTRTLSLLSPKEAKASHPGSSGNSAPKRRLETVNDAAEPSTALDLSTSTDGASAFDEDIGGPPKDLILETGKQLVGDFRQGLWTFFEDLRQVTVGDEAASTPDPRKQRALPSASVSQRQLQRERAATMKEAPTRTGDDSKTCEISGRQRYTEADRHDHHPVTLEDPNRSRSLTANLSESDDDGWDNWDTPKKKGATSRGNNSTSPMASPLTDISSSARTSSRAHAMRRLVTSSLL